MSGNRDSNRSAAKEMLGKTPFEAVFNEPKKSRFYKWIFGIPDDITGDKISDAGF